MENASKALLIAGGVLIALVIIGALVSNLTTVKNFQMSQLSQEEQEELIAFNEQYTKYLNQYVYGTEVITLQNKYSNDKQVKVILEEGSTQPVKIDTKHKYNTVSNKYETEIKYYKCTDITYDQNGRVNSITFKQIKPET